MKVAVFVITSNENLYIRDFVEYYLKIGVDNVILGDNSPKNGDHPQMVIGDYIDSGFVKYVNYRDYNGNDWQVGFYNKMISKYKNEYDWIAAFDIDEYLTFNNGITNIKEFLSNEEINKYGQIKVNWRVYGDNGKLYYENKPVMERFPNPTEPVDFLNICCDTPYVENSSTKVIVNCKVDYIEFVTPHVCVTIKDNQYIAACNPSGNFVNYSSGCAMMDYDVAQLNHYQTLTISEFLYRKFSRGGKKEAFGEILGYDKKMREFWKKNKKTKEKEEIANLFFKDINDGLI